MKPEIRTFLIKMFPEADLLTGFTRPCEAAVIERLLAYEQQHNRALPDNYFDKCIAIRALRNAEAALLA